MKDYCRVIEARQNRDKNQLVKTNWFREKTKKIIL
jgi:hypothetical protein